MGLQMRSMRSIAPLQLRLSSWDLIRADPDQLGSLLLDDLLLADASSGLHHSVFLFESVLLCCQDSFANVSSDVRSFVPCYPIAKWEFGPAMNGHRPLDVLFAIPTTLLKSVRRASAGTSRYLFLSTIQYRPRIQVLSKLTGRYKIRCIHILSLHYSRLNVISGTLVFRHWSRSRHPSPQVLMWPGCSRAGLTR